MLRRRRALVATQPESESSPSRRAAPVPLLLISPASPQTPLSSLSETPGPEDVEPSVVPRTKTCSEFAATLQDTPPIPVASSACQLDGTAAVDEPSPIIASGAVPSRPGPGRSVPAPTSSANRTGGLPHFSERKDPVSGYSPGTPTFPSDFLQQLEEVAAELSGLASRSQPTSPLLPRSQGRKLVQSGEALQAVCGTGPGRLDSEDGGLAPGRGAGPSIHPGRGPQPSELPRLFPCGPVLRTAERAAERRRRKAQPSEVVGAPVIPPDQGSSHHPGAQATPMAVAMTVTPGQPPFGHEDALFGLSTTQLPDLQAHDPPHEPVTPGPAGSSTEGIAWQHAARLQTSRALCEKAQALRLASGRLLAQAQAHSDQAARVAHQVSQELRQGQEDLERDAAAYRLSETQHTRLTETLRTLEDDTARLERQTHERQRELAVLGRQRQSARQAAQHRLKSAVEHYRLYTTALGLEILPGSLDPRTIEFRFRGIDAHQPFSVHLLVLRSAVRSAPAQDESSSQFETKTKDDSDEGGPPGQWALVTCQPQLSIKAAKLLKWLVEQESNITRALVLAHHCWSAAQRSSAT